MDIMLLEVTENSLYLSIFMDTIYIFILKFRSCVPKLHTKIKFNKIFNKLLGWPSNRHAIDMCRPSILSAIYRYLQQTVLRCFYKIRRLWELFRKLLIQSEKYDIFHVNISTHSMTFRKTECWTILNERIVFYLIYFKCSVMTYIFLFKRSKNPKSLHL